MVLEEGVCGSEPRLRAQPQCRRQICPGSSRRSVRRCVPRPKACQRFAREAVGRVPLRTRYAHSSDPFARCVGSCEQEEGEDCERVLPHAGLLFAATLPAYDQGAVWRLARLRAAQPKPLRFTQDVQLSRSPLYYQERRKSGKTTEQRFQNRMRARGGKCLEPECRAPRRVVVQRDEEDDAEF